MTQRDFLKRFELPLRPGFRNFLLSRFFITFAVQFELVAVSWHVYKITGDALALGFIGLVEAIPAIGLALIAGERVDKGDAKRWTLISTSAITLQALVLFFLAFFESSIPKPFLLTSIYSAIFLWGAARAFMRSSYHSLFPELVSRENYVRAEAYSSTMWQAAAASGPAMGGLCFGYFGAPTTYGLSFLFAAIGVLSIALIRKRDIKIKNLTEPWREAMAAGLKFVFSNRLMISAITLDMFAVLFGGAIALLPIFADQLGVGAAGLGWMKTAPFLGSLPVVFYMSQRPITKHAGKILLSCVAAFGVCWICFALSTNIWLSMALLVVSGGFDAVSVIVRGAIFQLNSPDHMRGRIAAVNGVFISSSNELGAMESGVAARVLGTVPSVIFGGVMTLLVVAFMAMKSKELLRLDLNSDKN